MTLYFAYGSNLNIEQMKRRCPNAKPLGSYVLSDSRLVFRGVADCIFEEGAECQGAVYQLTPECEKALDGYEGIEAGTYRKEHIPLTEPFEGEQELLVYVMNSDGIFPPSQRYLDLIIKGYKDFELPLEELRKAVRHSWKNKKPSWRERRRDRRDGHPKLGLSKTVTADHKPVEPPKPHVDGVATKAEKKWKQPDFFSWEDHGVVYGD